DGVYDTDKKQVIFITGHLRNEENSVCPASDWFRGWKSTQSTNGRLNVMVTFLGFWTDLMTAFEPKEQRNKAINKLKALWQSKKDLTTFFAEFELLITQAGYDTDNFIRISFLHDSLNKEILNVIANSSTAIPTTYDRFKQQCLQIESNWQWGKSNQQDS